MSKKRAKDQPAAAAAPPGIDDLVARLERLETAEAARSATWRYAVAIDTLDFTVLADTFTEDASLTTRRGTRTGRTEIVDYYRGALESPVARQHWLVNQQVTATGAGTARVESYFHYTFAGDDTSILGWGHYVDEVVVTDGVGRLSSKTISIGAHADVRPGWATEVTA
jgi:hypothetical protein